MNAFAVRPACERGIVFQEAAERLSVLPLIIEKDFWVTWLLGRIFATEALGSMLVFKGGTSPSKVFGVIHRFSEDIDLSISPAELGWQEDLLDNAGSASQRRKRFEQLEADCAARVQGAIRAGLEEAVREILGHRQNEKDWLAYELDAATSSPVLLFEYPSALSAAASYILRSVKVEFGSLTDQRPIGTYAIQPMIAEVLPAVFDSPRVQVVALELERSFWEKATILHAEHHRPAAAPMRSRFARHYSDFAALWVHPLGQQARKRLDLLERVVLHKSRFFASKWANYGSAKPGTFREPAPILRFAARGHHGLGRDPAAGHQNHQKTRYSQDRGQGRPRQVRDRQDGNERKERDNRKDAKLARPIRPPANPIKADDGAQASGQIH